MRIKLQIAVVFICLVVLIKLMNMVRKNKADLKYSFSWILADLGVILLCFLPETLKKIAGLLDIYEPLHLVIFIGFIFMGCLIFSVSKLVNDNVKKTVTLSQRLAILEKELEDLKQEKTENGIDSEK